MEGKEVTSEEQLLQVLNYSGLSGLEKLKKIGPTKATKILRGREEGLYTSVWKWLVVNDRYMI